MRDKRLASGSISSAEPQMIYQVAATITATSLLPLLLVNRSNNKITITVYWSDSEGGAKISIPAGVGKWRHMVGMPLGISTGDSIIIQSDSNDEFHYHLAGNEE